MTHSTQARRKAEQDKTRRFEYGVVKIRKQGERQAKGGNNENRKVMRSVTGQSRDDQQFWHKSDDRR